MMYRNGNKSTNAIRLKDECQSFRCVFRQKTKWRMRHGAADHQSRRWKIRTDQTYCDNNGRQSQPSADKHETVRPVLQTWNGCRRPDGRRKVALQVERLYDSRSGRGYFGVDQRDSHVLGAQQRIG